MIMVMISENKRYPMVSFNLKDPEIVDLITEISKATGHTRTQVFNHWVNQCKRHLVDWRDTVKENSPTTLE